MDKQVYIYSLEDHLGNVRYVGKTNDLKRRLKGHIDKINQHISHKNSWVKGLLNQGIKPIIKEVDVVPENEWEFWETYYIHLFRSWGLNLTNLTFGGDGLSNPTKEVRDKISNSLKNAYRNGCEPWNKGTKGMMADPWNKGVKASKELKDKVSRSCKETFENGRVTWNKDKKTGQIPWNKGVSVSVETKKKISDSMKGKVSWNKGVSPSKDSVEKAVLNNPNRKEVLQFDLQGNFIKEYISTGEATKNIKCNGISQCCKGKARSVAGFLWLYKKDFNENLELIDERVKAFVNKNKNFSRGAGKNSASSKSVIQLTLTGEFIAKFDCIKDANKFTGIKSSIGAVCNKKRQTAGGFRWMFLEDYSNIDG